MTRDPNARVVYCEHVAEADRILAEAARTIQTLRDENRILRLAYQRAQEHEGFPTGYGAASREEEETIIKVIDQPQE